MEVPNSDKLVTEKPANQKDQNVVLDIGTNDNKELAVVSNHKKGNTIEPVDDVKEQSTESNINDTLNCINKKSDSQDDVRVAIVKNNKQNNDSKMNEHIEYVVKEMQNLEVDISTQLASAKTKNDKGELQQEVVATKEGKEGKRKRRNLSAQDKSSPVHENGSMSKRKRSKDINDKFCWRCHKESVEAQCSACPRSWHRKCMGGTPPSLDQNWICGECAIILKAENAETRSIAMAQLSIDQLCMLLKYIVERMREYPGSEPFWKAVDLTEVPNYLDYVIKPMDLSLLECNVRAKLYGSTDAFMADAKWIQHNCIVFNTCGRVYADTSKLTNAARQTIKTARQEVSEIEACPDCFAHARNLPRPQPSWFIEPCRRPHPLVWAKLKGFPFWPAKAMPRVNGQGHVDVRFFGAHDRAWVPPRDLYLYSQDPPAPLPRKRKLDMDECVREITRHCRKLELAFGQFRFAPAKIQYNPQDPMQIKLMLPNYDPLHLNNSVQSQTPPLKKKSLLKKRGPPVRKKLLSNISPTSIPSDSTNLEASQLHSSNDDEKNNFESNEILKDISITPSDETDGTTSFSSKVYDNGDRAKEKKERKKSLTANVQNSNQNGHISPVEKDDAKLNSKSELLRNVKMYDENVKELHSTSVNVSSELQNNTNDEKLSEIPLRRKSSLNGKAMQKVEGKTGELKENSISKRARSKDKFPLQNSSSNSQVGTKSNKSLVRVYKPKTRMVNQVNAEKAMKSINDKEQIERMENKKLNTNKITTEVTTSFNNNSSSTTINSTVTTMISSIMSATTTDSISNTMNDDHNSHVTTMPSVSSNSNVDQPLAFLLLLNNGATEVGNKSILAEDSRTNTNSLAVIKQEPKDHHQPTPQKKESKARKSFPNKPPAFPQVASQSPPKASSNSPDAMVYIPAHRKDNKATYQLPPPEAGPLSAQLHNGAQELARRMAQLMEEALREAANSQDDLADNHQATVHFLQLQIERMRWQHQQQLAELKHNMDLTLKEMRASLEAEQLRAVEETRREAEEERLRSVEETKRKQWCALCGNEALFYCCWNTAYCDYPCQQAHWPTHMRTCAQNPLPNTIITSTAANPNSQQQQVMPRLVTSTHHATSSVWGA